MTLTDDGMLSSRRTARGKKCTKLFVAAATASLLALALMSMAPAAQANAQTGGSTDRPRSCRDVMIPTDALKPVAGNQLVYGRLCEPAQSDVSVLQVLVHGGTYSHTYWDFPGFNGRYSYAKVMNQAGYATLAIDLLGVGNSTHPNSVTLTAVAQARAVHDVIQAAKNDRLGADYSQVVTVGHSIGSVTAVIAAAMFHDVDGLVLSGFSHSPGLVGLAQLAVYARPAQLDPATRDEVPPLDLGYLSAPGSHAEVFYRAGDADPAVVRADEAARSPLAAGFLTTFPMYLPMTKAVNVPVLIANGQLDVMFCRQGGGGSLTNCATDQTLHASEAPFFPQSPDVEAFVLPGAGHILNLTREAPVWYARALQWFDEHYPRETTATR